MVGHGIYVGWRFSERVHCAEPRSRRKYIEGVAKSKGVPVRIIGSRHIVAEDFIHLGNKEEEFQKFVMPAIPSLNLDEVIDLLLRKSNDGVINERGNVQHGGGFASENHQLGSDGVTAPQPTKSVDTLLVKRMIAMTEILRMLEREVPWFEIPFERDPRRTERFAEYLCEHVGLPRKNSRGESANVIEHMTFALTSIDTDPPVIFGAHVDQFNCRQPGYDMVVCIYLHFRDPVTQKWYRLAIIAYSRSACHHFFLRDGSRTFLKQQLLDYHLASPNWRQSLTRKYVPMANQPPTYSLPCFDKCGFYSAFVVVLRRLNHTHRLSLQRFCEVLLVTGWLNTASNFHAVVGHWCNKDRLPATNLATQFITTMVDQYGHLCNGKGPRMQVSFNFSISTSKLLAGCTILFNVLKHILESTHYDYKDNIGQLTKIQGVGHLGAQHMLSIASLCSIIPPYFCSMAQLCAGTRTAKCLAEQYNIIPSVAEKLYGELSLELGVTVAYVENLTCEFPRENNPAKPYNEVEHGLGVANRRLKDGSYRAPDIFFPEQDVYKLRTDPSGCLEILCLCYDGRDLSMGPIQLKDESTSVDWLQPRKELDFEIKTSNKSRLAGSIPTEKKRQPRKPKRIKHSGIGVTVGLEQAVQERYRRRVDEDNEDSREADNASYTAHLSRSLRVNLAVQRSARTRNSTKLKLNVLLSATREDRTYCYIDWSTVLLSLHTQSGLPPSKKQKCRRGHRKGIRNFIRWQTLVHEGYTLHTCEFNHHRQTVLSSSDSLLLKTGFVMHRNKRAWYSSKSDAERALIVNILTHVATHRQLEGDPDWACSKLRPEMKGVTNHDFCVLYDSGGGNRSDTIFGVLFYRGDDRIFSVPNIISDYDGGWSDFCFRSIRSSVMN
jgi:hypothetical protein